LSYGDKYENTSIPKNSAQVNISAGALVLKNKCLIL